MKILIAEDQPVAALFLRKNLEAMGHEVVVVPDGEAALEHLGDIEVLISDWMMPCLDGPGLCRHVRAGGGGRYLYIILLTSRNGRDDRLEGLRAGADDFLTKPPDPDELAVRLEIAGRILGIHEELARRNAQLMELAATDPLTGVRNRRRFQEDLELLFAQARYRGSPLSLVMLDVDHFKRYNDTYGHPAGDEVLRQVGAALQGAVRKQDVVARYGGEEFAAILPDTEADAALGIAQRLRSALAAAPWPHGPVTASFGVATAGPLEFRDLSELTRKADEALYRSKIAGRDRISHASDCARPPGLAFL